MLVSRVLLMFPLWLIKQHFTDYPIWCWIAIRFLIWIVSSYPFIHLLIWFLFCRFSSTSIWVVLFRSKSPLCSFINKVVDIKYRRKEKVKEKISISSQKLPRSSVLVIWILFIFSLWITTLINYLLLYLLIDLYQPGFRICL